MLTSSSRFRRSDGITVRTAGGWAGNPLERGVWLAYQLCADDYGVIDFGLGGWSGGGGTLGGAFNYDGDINADDFASVDFNFTGGPGSPFVTGP